MNKKQKLEALFREGKNTGEIFYRPILMHFAARYAGHSYREFVSDFRILVKSNLRCLEDFNIDAVGLISDPYRETSAFGTKLSYPEEGVPRCEQILVRNTDDIHSIKNPDVYRSVRTRDRIDGAALLTKETNSLVPVIGWVEGPLAEACDLAGVETILVNLLLNPEFVHLLCDKVLITAKDFARAQVEAGCDIIGVGDAICSQVSTENYREFVKDRHSELFEYIHGLGARVKLHICGNITHLLPDIRETAPDIVDLDHMVDMEEAYKLLGPGITRCGNLDPVSVIQDRTAEDVRERARELCDKEKNRRFILSGGCEITVSTPSPNVLALREATAL